MKAQILATPPDADGKRSPIGLRLTNLPKSGTQLITTDTLDRHKDYVEIEAGKIIYHTIDGEVVFHVIREPGRYCITCGQRLPDHGGNGTALEASRAAECRAHVESHGKDAITHENWPHGYVSRPRTFECTIEDKRHG